MSRDVAYRNGYLPLFAGAELIRRSGPLTQFPAENIIGTLPPGPDPEQDDNYSFVGFVTLYNGGSTGVPLNVPEGLPEDDHIVISWSEGLAGLVPATDETKIQEFVVEVPDGDPMLLQVWTGKGGGANFSGPSSTSAIMWVFRKNGDPDPQLSLLTLQAMGDGTTISNPEYSRSNERWVLAVGAFYSGIIGDVTVTSPAGWIANNGDRRLAFAYKRASDVETSQSVFMTAAGNRKARIGLTIVVRPS